MTSLPLEGIRIVEMTVVWAGPYPLLLMGDMGAEIIRVESLQHEDTNTRGPARIPPSQLAATGVSNFPNGDPGDRPWERGSNFNYHGRHKFSVTMDLERPKGKEMFLRLIQKSDVFLTNYAVETLEKLGLTYPVLREANPKIIHVSLPGFGNDGPYKYFRGWGHNMEGVVGHTLLRGYPDMGPTGAGLVVHSDAAAAAAAFAVMAAVHYRSRTGKGQFVDMSQAENVAHHFGQAFMDYSMNRRVQGTLGNRHPFMAPHGLYPCLGEDAWLALSVGREEEWLGLCRAMGKPELAEDERFRDPLVRHRHQDDLDPIIAEWSREMEPYQAMHLLQKEGVPASPVLHHQEVFRDPHLRARGFFQSVTSPATGTHDYPGPLFRMSKTPLSIRRPAPMLGEHNEYVYKQIIGVSDEDYEELVRERHIGDTYVELLGE